MVRGWLRTDPKRPRLPESSDNARRGEYDRWESLGRLMLPAMHKQVDEIFKTRWVARSLPAPPPPTIQTGGDSGRQDKPVQEPLQPSSAISDDVTARSDNDDRPQSHNAEASDRGSDGRPRHSASRSASTQDNSREVNSGGPENATAAAGTHHRTNEDHNSRNCETVQSNGLGQQNRQVTSFASTDIPSIDATDEQIVHAYYEEPLSLYTRYPEPSQGIPSAYALHQTRIFCANCDPQA